MSLLQLLLAPANRSLVDVVTRLPNLGVGARVARKAWVPHNDSYWEVTDVKLRGPDGAQGRVWGVLTWRGRRAEGPPRQIGGAAKKEWRWVAEEEEVRRLAPLAAQLRAQERAARAAAAGGGGEAGGGGS
jgi:hypothetical protein